MEDDRIAVSLMPLPLWLLGRHGRARDAAKRLGSSEALRRTGRGDECFWQRKSRHDTGFQEWRIWRSCTTACTSSGLVGAAFQDCETCLKQSARQDPRCARKESGNDPSPLGSVLGTANLAERHVLYCSVCIIYGILWQAAQ
jgi:hypothetical protein